MGKVYKHKVMGWSIIQHYIYWDKNHKITLLDIILIRNIYHFDKPLSSLSNNIDHFDNLFLAEVMLHVFAYKIM